MKRSEILLEIKKFLRINYGNFERNDSVSEEILNKIEELGMLPPERIRHPNDKDWNLNMYPVAFSSNSWEPEND